MYRCQFCSRVPAPGTPQHRVVTATRVRKYPFRRDANSAWKHVNGKWKWVEIDDPGGIGVEIVSEMTVCPDCVHRQDSVQPVPACPAVAS